MKKEIRKILGEEITDSIEEMIVYFDKTSMDSKKIASHLKKINKTIRDTMHIIAVLKGKKELADKIKEANNIIIKTKMASFKKAVADGTYEQYLSQMSCEDKISLSVELDFFRKRFYEQRPYSIEEHQCHEIIERSIAKDIEKEGLRQEFSSVKAWEKHNFKGLSK